MFGVLLGIGLGTLIAVIVWFLTPLTHIKKGNVVIKLMGKKTMIPISDIQKVTSIDMLRGGYQIEIHTKKETFYGRVGFLEGFINKLHLLNNEIVVEEKTL